MNVHLPNPSVDLNRLKELAEAASSGPWYWELGADSRGWIASVTGQTGDLICDPPPEDCEHSRGVWLQNAAYIAAVDPGTVKALIARLEAAEAALRRGRSEDAGLQEPPSWAPKRGASPW